MDSTSLSDLLAGAKKNKPNGNSEADEWFGLGEAAYDDKNYEEAFQYYQKAAPYLPEAMYSLAWCYHHSQGTKFNAEEALKWYSEAAKYDYGPALYQMGFFHEFGFMGKDSVDLVKVDLEKAKEYYEKGTENGSSRASDALDDLLCVYNDKGDKEQWYQKGLEAWDNEKQHEAARWWRRAAEAGHVEAQCKLGRCYGSYSGFDRVHSEGIKWYTKAAEGGSAEAKYHLGVCYSGGWGVESDKDTAFKWYMKSAKQGYPTAQYCVAEAYKEGEGVKKDIDKAIEWYRKAAQNGDEDAEKALEEMGETVDDQPMGPVWTIQQRTFPAFLSLLLMLLAVTAIVLVRRMDQMSFRSITEEEAVEMAQEIKVSLPDQEVTLLNSGEKQTLKAGKTVKVLGVYKNKLNKGNSPRVYWTNQYYLMELPDGTRAYGPLMETAIGQLTVLPEGDTVVITAVKKAKKNPTVQTTGTESRFEYAYTLEGHQEPYALEDLHIYFPQRVAYLAQGLREEDYTAGQDTLAENKKDFQKVKKFFLYDIRPITKKVGFFVFPKYQVWNEFYLQRWFRNLMIFLAYIAEILVIFLWLPRFLRNRKENRHQRKLKRAYRKALKGDANACFLMATENGYSEEGLRWYKKAGVRGHELACYDLGKYYENQEQYWDASKWYSAASEISGNGPKYYDDEERVGRMCNAEMELYWAEKAKKDGDPQSMVQHYRNAAETGHKIGEYMLGYCYFYGDGIATDYNQAFKLFLSAATKGSAKAQFMLAKCYLEGKGANVNQDKGIKWLKTAAQNGDEQSIEVLNKSDISY